LWIAERSNWSNRQALPQLVLAELRFWFENADKVPRLHFEQLIAKPTFIVYSDASAIVCGAFIDNCAGFVMVEHWSLTERQGNSTWRELKAVQIFLTLNANKFEDKSIQWYTDNMAVPRVVQKGSMKFDLHALALEVYQICLEHNTDLTLLWIPREANEAADYLSKVADVDDWEVDQRIFNFLDKVYGPFSIDLFASHLSKKSDKFLSKYWCTGTAGVNAFAYSWAGEFAWLVPPPYLIISVLKHCEACKAKGVLIAPKWPSAPFWSYIYPGQKLRAGLHLLLEYKNPERFFKRGLFSNEVFQEARFASNVLVLGIDYAST
jgi:hypothetical protein